MKDCERADIINTVFNHNEKLKIDGYFIEVLRVRPHEWLDNDNDLALEVLITLNRDDTVQKGTVCGVLKEGEEVIETDEPETCCSQAKTS